MLVKRRELGRIVGIRSRGELRAVGERLVKKAHDHFAGGALEGTLLERHEHVEGVGGDLMHVFS